MCALCTLHIIICIIFGTQYPTKTLPIDILYIITIETMQNETFQAFTELITVSLDPQKSNSIVKAYNFNHFGMKLVFNLDSGMVFQLFHQWRRSLGFRNPLMF